MSYYDHTNVYSKISSLEDKVNRLEEIISYRNGEEYSFDYLADRGDSSPHYKSADRGDTTPHYKSADRGDTTPHYKSAVRLSRAAKDFKQDLIYNPRHRKLSRKNYHQIYERVSTLEKEIDDIVQNMNYERRQRSSYISDTNTQRRPRSKSYYEECPYLKGCDTPPKRYVLQTEPQRKQITYDKYIEEMPSESSSSESVEEIIYYIESSSSRSSSSSVIVEEYIPKSYTRRSVRREPIIDASKSKPRPSFERSPPKEYIPKRTRRSIRRAPIIDVSKSKPSSKSKTSRKRTLDSSETKQPKVKSKKGKKKSQPTNSDSQADTPKKKSELYLVKKSNESPKNTSKTTNKGKKEKFFVSRLNRVESSSDENDQREFNKRSSEHNSQFHPDKRRSKSENRRSINKEIQTTHSNENNAEQSKRRNKRKIRKTPQEAKQSTETVTVARSSFILNDPFVRTIYYDDPNSSEEEIKTSYSYNNSYNKSDIKRVEQGRFQSKPKPKPSSVYPSNIRNASIYEIHNSVYSFDPFFKQKGKYHLTDEWHHRNFPEEVSTNMGENKLKIHKVNKNDIVVLNDDKRKSRQQKFTFEKRKIPIQMETVIKSQEEKGTMTDKKISSSFYVNDSSKKALSSKPVAHSVYLTTVPIYKSSFHDFHSHPPKSVRSYRESNSNLDTHYSDTHLGHKTILLKDDVLMSVARKLSPVVARMISDNSKFNESKGKLKTRSKSSMKHFKNGNASNTGTQFYYRSDSQTEGSGLLEKGILSNRNDKFKHNTEENYSKYNEDETVINVINAPDYNRRNPVKSYVYFSGVKRNSFVRKNSGTKKENARKRSKSISSISGIISEHNQGKAAKERPSKHSIKNRKSITHQQKQSSKIRKKRKLTPQSSYNSDVEDQLRYKSQDVSSLDSAQSVQPRESVSRKSTIRSSGRKSGSRLRSMISRITSRDKIQKKAKEPALKSLLRKMKNSDKSSKVPNEEKHQSQRKISERSNSPQNYENKDVPLSRVNSDERESILGEKQERHSQVKSSHDSKHRPGLFKRMKSGSGTFKSLTRKRSRDARTRSKTRSLHTSKEEKPRLSRRKSSIIEFKNKAQDEDKHSEHDSIFPTDKAGQNLENTDTAFNNLRDNTESSELLYSSPKKEIRSVSGYFEDPKSELVPSAVMGNDVEINESLARQYEPEENEMVETFNNTLVAETNPEINENIRFESPPQDLPEEPRIIEDVQRDCKQPLHFSIHFSKENRLKCEPQSISSCDDICPSQRRKIYSTEELSLSEYAYDNSTEPCKFRKVPCKKTKNNYKESYEIPNLPSRHNMTKHDCYTNDCCKNNITSKSEQFISDSSYHVDWHKIADEIKQPH